MLLAAMTPRRKVALGLALAWFVPLTAFSLYAMHHRGPPPFLNWPFAVTAAWTLASALACGIVVAEAVRVSARASASWSEKRHFGVALLVALLCFAIQCLCLVLASQHMGSARAF